MKLKAISILLLALALAACNQRPADYAALSAPIAFGLARNAIKQSRANGEVTVVAKWENLTTTEGDWPKGNIVFALATPDYPGKQVVVQYVLDGTHNATAIVTLPNGRKEQLSVNLYESAIIMGQAATVESYFAKVARELAPKLAGHKAAVFDFEGINSESTILGKRAAESLVTTLVQDNVAVVERRLLDPLFKEIKFQSTGLTAESGEDLRKKIGTFLGADSVVVGTLKEDKEEIVINARAVDLKGGVILSTSQAVIPRYLFRPADLAIIQK